MPTHSEWRQHQVQVGWSHRFRSRFSYPNSVYRRLVALEKTLIIGSIVTHDNDQLLCQNAIIL
jgi:hypothetical protein